jgi:hypothetical protein
MFRPPECSVSDIVKSPYPKFAIAFGFGERTDDERVEALNPTLALRSSLAIMATLLPTGESATDWRVTIRWSTVPSGGVRRNRTGLRGMDLPLPRQAHVSIISASE